MSEKSFQDAQNPIEALELYLSSYDNLYGRVQIATAQRAVEHLFEDWRGTRVLEIGAGGGIWTEWFLQKQAGVTCIEIRKPILEGNRKKNPAADFILGDATTVRGEERVRPGVRKGRHRTYRGRREVSSQYECPP